MEEKNLVNEMEENSDNQNSDRSQTHGISNLIPNVHDNKAFEQNEEEATAIIENAMINRHRDKSKEVSQRVVEEDPSEVIGELHSVRDRIKEKVKQSLSHELDKTRDNKSDDDEEVQPGKNDLKLDLSLSTADQAGPSRLSNVTGRTDTSMRESSMQRIKKLQEQSGEQNNYRLKGSSRRDKTRFDMEVNISYIKDLFKFC